MDGVTPSCPSSSSEKERRQISGVVDDGEKTAISFCETPSVVEPGAKKNARASTCSRASVSGQRRGSASPWNWYNKGKGAEDPPIATSNLKKSPSTLMRKTQTGDHDGNHYERRKSNEAQPQTLFADAQQMKGALYENIDKKDYDVTDLYKTEGCWQAIARNERFGSGTLFVICVNAVWIGYDADHNKVDNPNDAELQFKIADQIFCVFFTFEWLVRFMSFEKKVWCMRDPWFRFDTFLVTLMVAETWVMPIVMAGVKGMDISTLSLLKILRLLRLTRMVRIMRAMPELMTMLKGMTAAFRSVAATCSLLIIFLYIFSIIFSQEHKGHQNEDLEYWFGTIPQSMWTLLLSGTFLDNMSPVANTLLTEGHFAYVCLFLAFVALASLTIINMLIGVLCEVVSAVAEAEKEKSVVSYVKGQLIDVLEELDTDGTGTISKDEFAVFLEVPTAVSALEQLGVDVPNLLMLVDILFDADNSSTTMGAKKQRQDFSAQPSTRKSAGSSGESKTSSPTALENGTVGVATQKKANSGSLAPGQDSAQEVANPDNPEITGLEAVKDNTECTDDANDEGVMLVQKLRSLAPEEEQVQQQNVELSFADMLEMILRLRSENVASVPDIVDLRKFIRWNSNNLLDSMFEMRTRIGSAKKDLEYLVDGIQNKISTIENIISEETDDEEHDAYAEQKLPSLKMPNASHGPPSDKVPNHSNRAPPDIISVEQVMIERVPLTCSPMNSPRPYDSPFNTSKFVAPLNSPRTPLSSPRGSSPRAIDAPTDVPSERNTVGRFLSKT